MTWNWQRTDWPNFTYESSALENFEKQFLISSGEFAGALRHVVTNDHVALRIELLSEEAVKTSEIEGEILNRDSVQSSLRNQFGLEPERVGIPAPERGIATVMVDLYNNFLKPIDDETMFAWHAMIFNDEKPPVSVGAYRTEDDQMQVVSGPVHKRTVHFEAPPASEVPTEMRRFVAWFNSSAPGSKGQLPALVRAAIGHLYFVSIHPFADGNGRIGRALAEKSLSQNLNHPTLIALAYTIERKRKDYYAALARNNTGLEITNWLKYFSATVLEAQRNSLNRLEFYISKSKFYDRLRDNLNERQQKVIARMFREGVDGFHGGLSAENYISITGTSRATATRDLHELVEKGALHRRGELRYTRYFLNLNG